MGVKIDWLKSMVSVQDRIHDTGMLKVPGIDTVQYTSGDAFGELIEFEDVPKAGTIQTGIYLDIDDNGVEVDLILFKAPITVVANNTPFGVSDDDVLSIAATITFATFLDLINNQSSIASGLFETYTAPRGKRWGLMVIRGAPTIAANSSPLVGMTILAAAPWKVK